MHGILTRPLNWSRPPARLSRQPRQPRRRLRDRPMDLKRTPKHLFAEILDRVHAANAELIATGFLPAGTDQSRVVVEPPREAAHGDMATNAAMVLAKSAGRKPRELAAAIGEKLAGDDLVAKVEVAGPGFINLTLKPAAWIEALH